MRSRRNEARTRPRCTRPCRRSYVIGNPVRCLSYPRYSTAIGRLPHALTSRHCRGVRSRRNEACTRPRCTRPRRGSCGIGNPVRCLSYPRHSAAIGHLRRRMPCRRGRRRRSARRRRRSAVVCWPKSGRPPPPTRRAHHAEQGRPRTNLPTVVPNRRLPKHLRQNRRNERHRSSSSCLPPVGPAARRDGSGGHRARELRASNSRRSNVGDCHRSRYPAGS